MGRNKITFPLFHFSTEIWSAEQESYYARPNHYVTETVQTILHKEGSIDQEILLLKFSYISQPESPDVGSSQNQKTVNLTLDNSPLF